MIIETIIRTCPKCGSENIVRNGRDYKGAQKYHCTTAALTAHWIKKTIRRENHPASESLLF